MRHIQTRARGCSPAAALTQTLDLRQPQWLDKSQQQLGREPSRADDSVASVDDELSIRSDWRCTLSAVNDAAPWQYGSSKQESSAGELIQDSPEGSVTTDYQISIFTTRRLGAGTTAKVFLL